METFGKIFTEKAVGLAFAVAFGLWAWMLNGMKDTVIEGQTDIAKQIVKLNTEVTQHQLYSAQASAEFREQIRNNTRRLEILEEEHRGRNGHRHVSENNSD